MSARFRAARIPAAFVAVVVTAMLVMAPVSADTEGELKKAQAELETLLNRIDAQQAEISRLQAEASVVAAAISSIEAKIVRTQAKIVEKKEQIRAAEEELRATQEQLDRRAWVAYENGPGSSLEFLLGATSLSDLTTRLEVVDRAAESDKDLIDQIVALQERLRRRAAELQSLVKEHRSDRGDKLAVQEDLTAKIMAGQLIANALEADRARAAELVEKLEDRRAAERLAAARAAQGGVFGACPVNGFVVYSDDFGAPRVGHLHAGNDMFAAEGTPIVAPFPGTVEDSSGGLGGLAVKVFGAAGWVYNAHLSAFEGPYPRQVSTGEVIGYVGDTGNAKGTSDHDHFEWHPNVIPPEKDLHRSPYGYAVVGTAIDPWPFLNSVC
jgi:peptidoglycan hydrolase CwlO-like protein